MRRGYQKKAAAVLGNNISYPTAFMSACSLKALRDGLPVAKAAPRVVPGDSLARNVLLSS
jgi:hypothetical protein